MYSISLPACVRLVQDHRLTFIYLHVLRVLEVSCQCEGFDDFWIGLCFAVSDLWINSFDIRVGDCTGVGLFISLDLRLRALGWSFGAVVWELMISPLGSHRSAAILTNPYISSLQL